MSQDNNNELDVQSAAKEDEDLRLVAPPIMNKEPEPEIPEAEEASSAKSTLSKIWNIVSIVLVAMVVLIAVFLMGARIFGLKTYKVISGSMTPKYNIGDLIYVSSVDPSTIKVGDAISFVLDDKLTVATHEVVGIDTETEHFLTKGITNNITDPPVSYKKVTDSNGVVKNGNFIGKVVFKIPYLGYVAAWVQNPPGTYIAVTIGAVLIVLVFLPDLINKKSGKRSRK